VGGRSDGDEASEVRRKRLVERITLREVLGGPPKRASSA
jgi:hypothetical protein